MPSVSQNMPSNNCASLKAEVNCSVVPGYKSYKSPINLARMIDSFCLKHVSSGIHGEKMNCPEFPDTVDIPSLAGAPLGRVNTNP